MLWADGGRRGGSLCWRRRDSVAGVCGREKDIERAPKDMDRGAGSAGALWGSVSVRRDEQSRSVSRALRLPLILLWVGRSVYLERPRSMLVSLSRGWDFVASSLE